MKHAERELKAMGYDLDDNTDGPNRWIIDGVMELLEVFESQGHSGSSAPYMANLFKKLALFEPTTPLTGEDWEWNELGYNDNMWAQNNRCSHVFKRKDGTAYDSQGIVFRDPDGTCVTSKGSCVDIEFPYTPKTKIVDRD